MRHLSGRTKDVYITSENGVQMNVTTSPRLDSSLKTKIDRNVIIPSSQRIIIPGEIELSSFRKEAKSVLIETSDDVFVISHNDIPGSSGGTTNIPLHKLSTKYVVISTEPQMPIFKSQFAVAATEDNTNVSVIFKMKQNLPLNIEGNPYYNGDVFHFRLERFETYQIEHITDLTGTFIESSVPIAAFSGNAANVLDNIGSFDHIIEQLPPIHSVDNTYIVPPRSGDRDTVIRITATENANINYVIGGISQNLSLTKLDCFDTRISSTQTCFIESETPILVTAFGLQSRSTSLGDPSMTIVQGLNQYLNYYKIIVPSGFTHNFLSIMIKNSSKDFLHINGTIIKSSDIVFEENVSAGKVIYNVRSIRVAEGPLTASTVNGERFGLIFSGAGVFEAYGFSGNSVLP